MKNKEIKKTNGVNNNLGRSIEENNEVLSVAKEDILKEWKDFLVNTNTLIGGKAMGFSNEMVNQAIELLPKVKQDECVLLSWDFFNGGIVKICDKAMTVDSVRKCIDYGGNLLFRVATMAREHIKFCTVL